MDEERRDFIKSGAVAVGVAGVALTPALAAAAKKKKRATRAAPAAADGAAKANVKGFKARKGFNIVTLKKGDVDRFRGALNGIDGAGNTLAADGGPISGTRCSATGTKDNGDFDCKDQD